MRNGNDLTFLHPPNGVVSDENSCQGMEPGEIRQGRADVVPTYRLLRLIANLDNTIGRR